MTSHIMRGSGGWLRKHSGRERVPANKHEDWRMKLHRSCELLPSIYQRLHRSHCPCIDGQGIVIFQWDAICEQAFKTLKKKLTEAPVMTTFGPSLLLSMHTDASMLGLGAVLCQGKKCDKWVLVYLSRCFNIHEKNYGIPQLEALAII